MCPAFLQLWCNVIVVNLLTKTNSIVICVSCMLEHVCYVSLKNCRFGKYLMLIG